MGSCTGFTGASRGAPGLWRVASKTISASSHNRRPPTEVKSVAVRSTRWGDIAGSVLSAAAYGQRCRVRGTTPDTSMAEPT